MWSLQIDITVQQGGAPSHTARDTVRYLQRNNVAFTQPDIVATKQSGLESGGLCCSGALQQLVYRHRSFTSVPEAGNR